MVINSKEKITGRKENDYDNQNQSRSKPSGILKTYITPLVLFHLVRLLEILYFKNTGYGSSLSCFC